MRTARYPLSRAVQHLLGTIFSRLWKGGMHYVIRIHQWLQRVERGGRLGRHPPSKRESLLVFSQARGFWIHRSKAFLENSFVCRVRSRDFQAGVCPKVCTMILPGDKVRGSGKCLRSQTRDIVNARTTVNGGARSRSCERAVRSQIKYIINPSPWHHCRRSFKGLRVCVLPPLLFPSLKASKSCFPPLFQSFWA